MKKIIVLIILIVVGKIFVWPLASFFLIPPKKINNTSNNTVGKQDSTLTSKVSGIQGGFTLHGDLKKVKRDLPFSVEKILNLKDHEVVENKHGVKLSVGYSTPKVSSLKKKNLISKNMAMLRITGAVLLKRFKRDAKYKYYGSGTANICILNATTGRLVKNKRISLSKFCPT